MSMTEIAYHLEPGGVRELHQATRRGTMVARGRIKAALPPGDGKQERWICSGGCLRPLQGRQDGGRGCRCDGTGGDTLRRYRPSSVLPAVWRPRFGMPGYSGMCPGTLGGLGRLGGDNRAYAA